MIPRTSPWVRRSLTRMTGITAMAEYREALRLNPNNDSAHVKLGLALEQKARPAGEPLEEFHAACTLEPDNAFARQNYERLSRRLSKS